MGITFKKCPNCDLTNPETSRQCKCGYDFSSGQITESSPQREYASVLTRLGAISIDGLILLPFYIPIFATVSMVENSALPPEEQIVPSIILLVSLLGSVIFALWNSIIRMGKTGQSLGRKFLNIAVLDENGQPIGTGRALLREVVGRWVSSLICYIGYLNAFWDARKQMWHDKMANCFVYYVDDNFS